MNRKDFYKAVTDYEKDHLEHHGIIGQKWGRRRWQNSDGSLTPEGREHYGYGDGRDNGGKDSTVKSKAKKPAFDDSTRLKGKEEEDAWKALAKYYESQQNSINGKKDGESAKPKSNDSEEGSTNDKSVDDAFNNFTKDKWGKSASGKVKIGDKDVKLLVNGDDIKDTEKMKSNTKRAVNELSKSQKEMIDNIANALYKIEKGDGNNVSLSKIKKSFSLYSMYMSNENNGSATFWSSGSGLDYADSHSFTTDFWFDENGKFVIDKYYSMDG